MTGPRETFTLGDGAEGRLWINGPENVILQLRPAESDGWQDALTWGFRTVAEWRLFAKACLRFDNSIGARA